MFAIADGRMKDGVNDIRRIAGLLPPAAGKKKKQIKKKLSQSLKSMSRGNSQITQRQQMSPPSSIKNSPDREKKQKRVHIDVPSSNRELKLED